MPTKAKLPRVAWKPLPPMIGMYSQLNYLSSFHFAALCKTEVRIHFATSAVGQNKCAWRVTKNQLTAMEEKVKGKNF